MAQIIIGDYKIEIRKDIYIQCNNISDKITIEFLSGTEFVSHLHGDNLQDVKIDFLENGNFYSIILCDFANSLAKNTENLELLNIIEVDDNGVFSGKSFASFTNLTSIEIYSGSSNFFNKNINNENEDDKFDSTIFLNNDLSINDDYIDIASILTFSNLDKEEKEYQKQPFNTFDKIFQDESVFFMDDDSSKTSPIKSEEFYKTTHITNNCLDDLFNQEEFLYI